MSRGRAMYRSTCEHLVDRDLEQVIARDLRYIHGVLREGDVDLYVTSRSARGLCVCAGEMPCYVRVYLQQKSV